MRNSIIARSDNLLIISEWIPQYINLFSTTESYIEFWRNQGYKFADIPSSDNFHSMQELTDTELSSFFGDVLIAKDFSLVNEMLS